MKTVCIISPFKVSNRRYSYNFFINNLEIAPEDLTLFIAFAEPGLEPLVEFLKPENDNLKLILLPEKLEQRRLLKN